LTEDISSQNAIVDVAIEHVCRCFSTQHLHAKEMKLWPQFANGQLIAMNPNDMLRL